MKLWHQIQTQDGYLGWIHSFYICEVNVPNNDFMKITTEQYINSE